MWADGRASDAGVERDGADHLLPSRHSRMQSVMFGSLGRGRDGVAPARRSARVWLRSLLRSKPHPGLSALILGFWRCARVRMACGRTEGRERSRCVPLPRVASSRLRLP